MDDSFLKWLIDPIECDLLEPDEVCEFCVFRNELDCPLFDEF